MKTLLLTSLVLLIGCGDTDFRKVENLDAFRILAIEADAPEVAPGGTANLRLFVSDPTGPTGGRTLTGSTVSCIDPGISLGAEVSCDKDPNRVTGTYTVDTTTADLQNNLGTGYSGTISVTVPGTILAGRSTRERTNGVGYIVIFTFTVDGREIKAFKRVIATERTPLNTNPTGSTVLLNGGAIAGRPQKEDRLNLTTSAPESYTFINVDGDTETRTEELDVAWFISKAEFDRPKADLGEAVKITKEPPADQYLIISVVRDERGGLEVVRTTIP